MGSGFIREPRQNAAAQAAGAAQDGSITTKSFHIPKLSMTPNLSKITVKDKHRKMDFLRPIDNFEDGQVKN